MNIRNSKNRIISDVIIFSSLILVFIITSCKDQDEVFITPPTPGGCDTTNITFSSTVQQIVSTKCNCHGVSAPNFAVYNNLKAAVNNGKLLLYIQPGQHVSYALDTCEVKQITAWINKGAPNN
ncbi:MAG: hypothetical protein EPN82_03675 [Bacteroidetes bacterium]|nr:MAG: hypothetical protein EPN82_03675 [Bacteroidota bacterium]